MRELHIEPVSLVARLIEEDGSYDRQSPYEAVLYIQKAGKTATLVGCHGEIDLWAYRRLMDALRDEYGVTEVRWLRGDKEIVKELGYASGTNDS